MSTVQLQQMHLDLFSFSKSLCPRGRSTQPTLSSEGQSSLLSLHMHKSIYIQYQWYFSAEARFNRCCDSSAGCELKCSQQITNSAIPLLPYHGDSCWDHWGPHFSIRTGYLIPLVAKQGACLASVQAPSTGTWQNPFGVSGTTQVTKQLCRKG